MPRKRLTREEKRALTRAEILDAAEAIFPRRGYHEASVDEIAEAAGLTTGAVYSNFDSKADLCLALYDRHLSRHAEGLQEVVARAESPVERIEEASRHWLEFVRRDTDWLLLDLEFWAYAARYPDLRERYGAIHRRMRQTVADLLAETAETFGLDLAESPQELSVMMNALSLGFVIEKVADPEGVPDDALETALLSMVKTRIESAAIPPGPEAA